MFLDDDDDDCVQLDSCNNEYLELSVEYWLQSHGGVYVCIATMFVLSSWVIIGLEKKRIKLKWIVMLLVFLSLYGPFVAY